MGELRFCFTGLSNMHHCCAFLFALDGFFLLVRPKMIVFGRTYVLLQMFYLSISSTYKHVSAGSMVPAVRGSQGTSGNVKVLGCES